MALKFIAKLGKGSAELRALEREIAIMSKLRHKNIISLHECIETDSEVKRDFNCVRLSTVVSKRVEW